MSKYTVRLLDKEKIAQNVWKFTFTRPGSLDFVPGQYVRIFHPESEEKIFRDFSFSSSPSEIDTFSLTIKEGRSEYKKMLFSLPLQSDVPIEAPMGRFYLQEGEKKPLVFIAGGVGIAPFYSMIVNILQKHEGLPMTLFASFSTVEDVLFFNELKKIEEAHENIQIIYTITQPQKSYLQWNAHTGRISEDLIRKYVQHLSADQFLLCGSPSFVSDMENLLLKMDVSPEQLRTEIFLGFN